MKKHKKKIIIGAIILIIIIILVVRYVNNKKKQEKTPELKQEKDDPGVTGYKKVTCGFTTVLKRGISCSSITFAQNQINTVNRDLGIDKLTVDGKFGPKTEIAFEKLLGKTTGTYNEVLSAVNDLGGGLILGIQ